MQASEISFDGAGRRLSGTVSVPDGLSECPGVVLIGGSGPSDRHNGGLFDALSESLVTAGVAVLAYDKRGAGRSTGSWATATLDQLAADAGCAVAYLRTQSRVAGDGVGVLGHSEGGWVALRLCARERGVAHVILNSCPAMSFVDSEVFALTRAGLSPQDAERAGSLMRELTQLGYEDAMRTLAAVEQEPWYPALQAQGFDFDRVAWEQLRAWGCYDPLEDLNRLTTPTLVVFGADDPLVPVDASARRYAATARRTGRTQHVATFPGADHRLRVARTGGLAPGYLATLSDWSLNRSAATLTPGGHSWQA